MKVFTQYQTFALFMMSRGVFLMMIFLGCAAMILGITERKGGAGPFAIIGLLMLCVPGLFLWNSLRMPTKIELHDDGLITFSSYLWRIELKGSQISTIRSDQFRYVGLLVVEHTEGEFKMINQFDGFHEFLTELKRLNPSVELRGC